MTPERWQQVRGVLEQALELAPEKRPSFLDVACLTDPSLRGEVQSLLSADEHACSSLLMFPPIRSSGLTAGTKLGDYEIVSQLGSGGMGVVYRARDLRLGRVVAIKVLPAHLSSDTNRLKRFEHEAQAAAALNHPNILAVYQLGTYEGAPYLVSELLEGETLREELKQEASPEQRTVDFGEQIADGLSAAHEKGIIHRDLKPENLFVTKDGRVKILDFGLAKLAEPEKDSAETEATAGLQTQQGVIAGTIAYMSPEQVRGEKLDVRTDLFSFGVVLYEMVTGKRPFDGDTTGVTFDAILNRKPVPPTQLSSRTSPELERIITKALEKDRNVRYQHASAIRTDLKRLKHNTDSVRSAVSQQGLRGLPGKILLPADTLSSPKVRISRALIGGLSLALIAALLFVLNAGKLRTRILAGSRSPEIHSLAVLPLENLSKDPGQDYFSDGMTDALTTELAQSSSLRVISRTSVVGYKKTGKTLPEIARELGVDAIVEGTVQRSGDRVRITAQLIHGPTDKHLWANSYERDMSDVFTLERVLTEEIAHQIQARLTTSSRAPVAPSRPVNLKALEAYFQGNYHLQKALNGPRDEEMRTAGEYFQNAIDADPNFAPAYIGLSEAHHNLWWPSSEDFALMRRAAERAIELAPNSSDAREALGSTKLEDGDWSGAEEEFRRAIALNPNSASAHDVLGNVLEIRGEMDEGWKETEIAQELDPNQDHLSDSMYRRGEYDAAIALLLKLAESRPEDGNVHYFLAQNYFQKGMYKEWVQELGKAMTLYGFQGIATRLDRAFATSGQNGTLRQWAKELEQINESKQGYFPGILAAVYAALGDKDRAFYWLEQGCAHRRLAMSDPILPYLIVDPSLAPLRSDPRFADLLRRAGLAQ